MKLVEISSKGVRRSFDLDPNPSKAKGEGGAGIVYAHPLNPDQVIKIYKPHQRLPHKDKVQAMLANQPAAQNIRHENRDLVQIAWPQALVADEHGVFQGFTMPIVDFTSSTEVDQLMQRADRRAEGLPEAYQFRVYAARNLASLVTELHARGHYVIDMKPQNMRVYRANGFIAMIDCDGFSVRSESGRRYPAALSTPNYLCPEGFGGNAADLEEEQDRFALAVVIFQLLNNGVHPYQGRIKPGRGGEVPDEISQRISKGVYAHARDGNGPQAPHPMSLLTWMDDCTVEMFDRAFGTGRLRPTAREWRDELSGLVRRLVQCNSSTDHQHFAKGCGLCDQERRAPKRPSPPQSGAAAPVQLPAPPIIYPPVSSGLAQPSHQTVGASPKLPLFSALARQRLRWALAGLGMFLGLALGSITFSWPILFGAVGFGLGLRRRLSGNADAGIVGGIVGAALGYGVQIPLLKLYDLIGQIALDAGISWVDKMPIFFAMMAATGFSFGLSAQFLREGINCYFYQVSRKKSINIAAALIVAPILSTAALSWRDLSAKPAASSIIHNSVPVMPVQTGPILSAQPPDPTLYYRTSFDCAKASKWAEHEVCTSKELAELDLRLDSLYQQHVKTANYTDKSKLKVGQQGWLTDRNKCKGDADTSSCLLNIYTNRIRQIQEVGRVDEITSPQQEPSVIDAPPGSSPTNMRIEDGNGADASRPRGSWYYCDDPGASGYYPYITKCSREWRPVAPTGQEH